MKTTTKKGLTSILAGIGVAAAMAASAQAADVRLLASWDKSNWPTYAALDRFVKNVKKVGGDAVNIQISGPEVVPPFQQLQPVKSGVFQMLFTHGVYHLGSKGIAATMDAVDPDPVRVRESGVWGFVDKYYQDTHGLKLVMLTPSSTQGYHIFLKKPLSGGGDFKGRKIRGTQSYHGVIRHLGGEPVVMPGSQIYSALEKGVVDGAAWPAAGMLSMKHYEVAKYKIRPTFGASWLPILANKSAWDKLDQKSKDVMMLAAYMTELEMPSVGDTILADESGKLEKLGVKVTELSAAKSIEVKKTFNESIWKLGVDCCGDKGKEMRSLAVKAGLSN